MLLHFDTSIWLDFFEYRDEPNLPKGMFAEKLVNKIIVEDERIVYSEAIKDELSDLGYSTNEIEELFEPLGKVLIFSEVTKKQFGKAKDLSAKRNVPLFDALHALIARDNKAIMVTRDAHFNNVNTLVLHSEAK